MKRQIRIVVLAALSLMIPEISAAGYSFSFSCDRPAMAGFPDSINVFQAPLTNTGQDDSFSLAIAHRDHPGAWITTLCIDFVCFGDSFSWPLEAGATSIVKPDFTPYGVPGDGWITVRIKSFNNPADSQLLDFFFTAGQTTLVVCGDPNGNYAEYYGEALNELGVPFNNWPRWFAPITVSDIQFYTKLIWFTGDAVQTLTTADISIISGYLDAGRDLFISGQGIASDLRDSSFLNDYLHAAFYQTEDLRQIEGIAADTISYGLSFSISGQGGADNQNFPSSIIPKNYSTPTLVYGNGHIAGVKYSNGVSQRVFFPFGFEAIADSSTRVTLAGRIADFFEVTTDINYDEPGLELLPGSISLVGNYPNPFNSSTTIIADVGIGQEYTISVFDVGGRLVKNLHQGWLAPGNYLFPWNALNNSSGVYYCRAVGIVNQSLPLLLLK
ncbi:MAG: hypothetical protein CO189_12550 [candidate division Zixibacteria bacterium CG_4_9_14_3_um_filter_46_8]|nr:MAG: hypothetical protein CO189_12550 [candidate division Zixibacteria bacterium CG_4_9_14_3_um_filter_46_8]